MLAHVQVEQHADLQPGGVHRGGEFVGRRGVVDQCGERRAGELADQSNRAADVRPDERVRDQHVRRAGGREHLRFRDGRALVFRHARAEQQFDDLDRLVRLHVRAEPRRATGHLNHARCCCG